ncbi:MAG: hypothetical protein K8R36_21050 [Planctomycetales bacterium]|nr:hypothetical protein [Planctomycetales bacterium]
MPSNFVTHFCVPEEKEFLIAEIYFAKEHFAELNTECGDIQLVLYPRESGAPWTLPLKETVEVLDKAEQCLRERSTWFLNNSDS